MIKAHPFEEATSALLKSRVLLYSRTFPPHSSLSQKWKKRRMRSRNHISRRSLWVYQGKRCHGFQRASRLSLINIKYEYLGPLKIRHLTMRMETQLSAPSKKVSKVPSWRVRVRMRGPSSWCKAWAILPLPSPLRRTGSQH